MRLILLRIGGWLGQCADVMGSDDLMTDHDHGLQRRPATPAEVKALASPTRLRILRYSLNEPLTNRQLAERLGISAASSLYHVRRLTAVGLLEADERRPRPAGGFEIPYRSTGRSWQLELTEEQRPTGAMVRAFTDEIAHVDPTDVPNVIRWSSRLTDRRRVQLVDRLKALLDEYSTDDADGEPWSVFVAVHR